MTEKKKRGRPRKVVDIKEHFNDIANGREDEGLKFGRVISVQTPTPYPDNWASMGKVDRLAWLTANPR